MPVAHATRRCALRACPATSAVAYCGSPATGHSMRPACGRTVGLIALFVWLSLFSFFVSHLSAQFTHRSAFACALPCAATSAVADAASARSAVPAPTAVSLPASAVVPASATGRPLPATRRCAWRLRSARRVPGHTGLVAVCAASGCALPACRVALPSWAARALRPVRAAARRVRALHGVAAAAPTTAAAAAPAAAAAAADQAEAYGRAAGGSAARGAAGHVQVQDEAVRGVVGGQAVQVRRQVHLHTRRAAALLSATGAWRSGAG